MLFDWLTHDFIQYAGMVATVCGAFYGLFRLRKTLIDEIKRTVKTWLNEDPDLKASIKAIHEPRIHELGVELKHNNDLNLALREEIRDFQVKASQEHNDLKTCFYAQLEKRDKKSEKIEDFMHEHIKKLCSEVSAISAKLDILQKAK